MHLQVQRFLCLHGLSPAASQLAVLAPDKGQGSYYSPKPVQSLQTMGLLNLLQCAQGLSLGDIP